MVIQGPLTEQQGNTNDWIQQFFYSEGSSAIDLTDRVWKLNSDGRSDVAVSWKIADSDVQVAPVRITR